MREETVTVGQGGKYPLGGTLTLPDRADKCPALLFVHGSGPLNRDEKIGAQTPFRDIAEYLAENGVAALRYDKRTFAYRKTIKNDLKMPTVEEETIEDAILAARLLKSDPRIDAGRIFLAGHSLGGMLAPRIDAEAKDEGVDFAGIIVMAGSPRRFLDIIASQNASVIAALKGPIKAIAGKQVASFTASIAEYDAYSAEEAKSRKLLNINAYYFKEMDARPAAGYLEKLEKPVLFLQGAADFQVSAEKDFEGYKRSMAGKPNAAFRLYPGLSHAFTPSVYGSIMKHKKEYKIPAKVDGRVMRDIKEWIAEPKGDV